jgi:hypothetical protein
MKLNGRRHPSERGGAQAAAHDGDLAGADRSRAPRRGLAQDLSPDEELDAANSTKGSTKTDRRRRRRASRWGGRRRGCDSGELLPAVLGRGTSTSGTAGLLTSTRSSWCNSHRREGNSLGDRSWWRRPRVLRQRRLGSCG